MLAMTVTRNTVSCNGHIAHLMDLPLNQGLVTLSDDFERPFSSGEVADMCAIRVDEQEFNVLCLRSALQTAKWFHLIERVKTQGLRYKGTYTAEQGVLDLLRLSTQKIDNTHHLSATKESDRLVKLLEESNGFEWFRNVVKISVDFNASDIHIEIREEYANIRVRLDGVMRDVMKVPAAIALSGLASAYTMQAEERSRSEVAFNKSTAQAAMIPLDLGSLQVNLRYQTHPVVGGLDATLRILKNKSGANALDLEDLGYLPQQIEDLITAIGSSSGGVFVAGITGSGKTTTLNTLLSKLINGGLRKVVSIEDPVEYIVKGVSHYSIQRAANDSSSDPFRAAMMAFLRMDPDVGMIGEVRDKTSAYLVEAAIQTGHKILTTVHATSALGILNRLKSSTIGLSLESLCSPGFIAALVYQSLVPLNCPHCKLPASAVMDPNKLMLYHTLFDLDTSNIYVASENGCMHCRVPGIDYTNSTRVGVKGVKVAAEIVRPNEQLLRLLLKGENFAAKAHWTGSRRSRFDEPDMQGKEVWQHVLYDISRGDVDPFYFEYTFGPPILFSDSLKNSPRI